MKRHRILGKDTAIDVPDVPNAKLAALHSAALAAIIGGSGLERPPEQPHPSPGTTDSGSSPPTTGK